MYKQESNDLRIQVSLNGYKMQLTMGSHSRGRVYQRTNCDVSDVFHRIALLLENPSVSEYITLDVKIGDNCVIFDGDTGLSYALAVEETEITVKTVYTVITENGDIIQDIAGWFKPWDAMTEKKGGETIANECEPAHSSTAC